ncbi:hypothetical protein G1H11_05435 [Phytoactinopolyspora alkaliphila]|uniref:Cytosine permease n=1 Tax=Phytoactinopolyspora alkaliphila TaxID=1783498 RepID=A0A6N9YIQ5_9ACTN|nr:cytosine permease [Phytoactinopolyspora alkaliphila]NED94749.1 hypothetical protein [Phytoactinopolyspora alkaliphila]
MHDHALSAVPLAQRRSTFQLMAVAFGWVISISGFLVGGTLGGGLEFGQGLSAILLGNVILAVIATLIGLIGYRTGMTTYLISRTVFGRQGSILVSLVLGVLAMGFIGVLLDSFGTAFVALVDGVPKPAVIFVFAIAVLLTALFGFSGLAWISRIAAPALILFALIGLIRLGTGDDGFSAAIDSQPAAPISFDVGLTAVIATWITGAALTSDIARYAHRGRDVVIATFCGYVLGAGFFEFVAMISSNAAGTPNFVVAMSNLGLLLPAVIVLVLALWTTTDNNIYSSSLAFTNASKLVGVKVPKPAWVVVATLIAVGVAFLGFAADFLSFLQIIAVVTPPLAGVVITHFWVLGHIRNATSASEAQAPTLRIEALIAWVATSLFAHFADLPVAPLTALVIAGALYGLLVMVTRRRTKETV